jgi:hypothetical protein
MTNYQIAIPPGREVNPPRASRDSINTGARRPMGVLCAWCGTVIEEGPGPESHGICPECIAEFLTTLPETRAS